MKLKILSTLSLICFSLNASSASLVDPLPNMTLPAGHVKQLGAEFVKAITGKAVEQVVGYLIDYSHASFQLERASWREGLSHRYAQRDTQTFRRIDWISKTRANFLTETIEIDLVTGIKKIYPKNQAAFSDHEEAKRYWKSYITVNGKLQREKAWIMVVAHRLRNTYYKAAQFPSKQMQGPLYPRLYYRIQTLAPKEIDKSNLGFQPTLARGYKSVHVPLNGVSNDFTLIVRPNTRRDCDFVTDLFLPGSDDNGMNTNACRIEVD